MKIDVLCSDPEHPVFPHLQAWIRQNADEWDLTLLDQTSPMAGGDILFLVSCTQIVKPAQRDLYRHTMVLHASDLPKGRGWSPHIWAILNGAQKITISLLDAENPVDTGAIWAQRQFSVSRGDLYDDINTVLFKTEIALMAEGIQMVSEGRTPVPQSAQQATYYPRRGPQDSELDPQRTLAEQFDKIRVADPNRYPAYFKLFGETYILKLEKVRQDD